MNIRERHSHVFRGTAKGKASDEKCDAALLLAAGDEMAVALTGFHLRATGGEPAECNFDCEVDAALRRWRKATDG
jgi:hypothetical protein